jgi:hypothetical protein
MMESSVPIRKAISRDLSDFILDLRSGGWVPEMKQAQVAYGLKPYILPEN